MMKRLIPDTLAKRTLLALILALAVSHAISIGLYISDRTQTLATGRGEHIGDRITMVDQFIRNSSVQNRPQLLALADGPRMHVTISPTSPVGEVAQSGKQLKTLRSSLIAHLNPDKSRKVRLKLLGTLSASDLHPTIAPSGVTGDRVDMMLASLSLPDGSWLNFTVPTPKTNPIWNIRFTLSMVIMFLAVIILSVLAVHYLIRPLSLFSSAARRLGADVDAPPMPESGPTEIREASMAFNEMQARLRNFVQDRTQMIAAISHDLATPIARMRLRTEYVEDKEQYTKMLSDLDDMEKMVSSTLAFARNDAESEPSARVDLRILLQRICNDATDMGQPVSLQIKEEPVPFACHPTAMRRALGNLIDNAVKHGKRAYVMCNPEPDLIRILIEDEGPGIPEDRLEDVFKPFHRLETSRNRETGGTGLGMTVARSIIRAHGGDIKLAMRKTCGLRVEVTLPR
jgi:signal transduction histidine kinase